MGKNLEQQQETVVCHQHRSKCMWGIFHHLNHYRWNTVKKRLPYRKRATPKNEADGDPESKATSSEKQEKAADTKTENTPIEAKTAESGSNSKSKWMKSRLKSLLFTDEGSKRKGRGRHRRSSSCPTTEQTPHIATNPTPKTSSTNNVQTSLASLLDPPLPIIRDGQVTSKHTCDLCIAMLKMNYLKQSEIGNPGLHTFEDHTLLQNRLIYAIEPTKAASLQESKLFLKALDLLNVRKEVFLKILQDSGSSLAQQLHDRHTSNKLRVGLGKSMTFPSPGSRGGNVKCVGNHTQEKNSVASIELNRGNRNGSFKKKMCTDPELLDNVTKHSEKKNKHGLRHFLRDKLRFAIKESKKERQRIVMDGVLDKIPRGRRMPKEGEGGSAPHFSSQFGKSTHHESMKRASSFHESPERYNQLLESCFQRESQSQIAEEQRDYKESGTTNNKTLERFMSLPDLRCYKSEDSQYDTSSVRTNTKNNNVGRSESNSKVIYTPTGSEYHTLSEANSDEILQDGFQDVGDTFDANITEPTNSMPEMNLQDTTSATEEKEVEEEEEESPLTGLNILMDLHVDNKNKAQFDYVKDVLELSGFSGIEAEMLPLNPTLFDQVEGCLLAQPDCTGNEAGGTCDHLLLFDLINDVLLEMYERSFSYWPRRLTCHSYIRRMPVGYRVLEEVWANINWLLGWSHEHELSVIEDAVSHDLSKGNNWMNLQFDAECAGLELEELILDDLLDELLYDDLLLF